MGCQQTKCNNCKRTIKNCQKKKAHDGRSCCEHCVASYNQTLTGN